ncbi:hypothetical protein IFM61606_01992 [Aspergillus udagawae]|uniref:Uncharacterized protein n=1 Tax=Aspergillus udagawae TaxID=91492 RepID=A0ABQ1A1A3_9EURO|nr:hypothetical protein IFM53868_00477 [Aspergillus udagawae]GFG22136.1 hypothetical protein IFM61606_01992 [Aspergillus udagawae]
MSPKGQYKRVYLEDILFKEHIQAPKQWYGAPFPIIRRAISALGSPRIGHVPPEMITKLTILRDLYYLDDEEEAERKHGLERPSRDDDYQDSEEEEDEEEGEEEEEDKNEEYETEDNEGRQ